MRPAPPAHALFQSPAELILVVRRSPSEERPFHDHSHHGGIDQLATGERAGLERVLHPVAHYLGVVGGDSDRTNKEHRERHVACQVPQIAALKQKRQDPERDSEEAATGPGVGDGVREETDQRSAGNRFAPPSLAEVAKRQAHHDDQARS